MSKPKPRCEYVHRSGSVAPGLPGVSLGECGRECFPGLTACYEHADKAVLAALARGLMADLAEARKKARK